MLSGKRNNFLLVILKTQYSLLVVFSNHLQSLELYEGQIREICIYHGFYAHMKCEKIQKCQQVPQPSNKYATNATTSKHVHILVNICN
jgi:hypothetical protein